MKRTLFFSLFFVTYLLIPAHSRAQSLKDIVSKVVSGVTGKSSEIDLEGTWNYTGSAIEFESDDLLKKAGGSVAASLAEGKLNEQLEKVGITADDMSFTFNADSTFTIKLKSKNVSGSYSYDSSTKTLDMKLIKILNLSAKVNYSSSKMDLLFDTDKLLSLVSTLGNISGSTILDAIGSLASSYEGMMMGLSLKKE